MSEPATPPLSQTIGNMIAQLLTFAVVVGAQAAPLVQVTKWALPY